MRLYNFSRADYAIENIEKARLKISRINELNDPFELLPANLKDKQLREAFRSAKKVAQNKKESFVLLTHGRTL